jgi:hypothetical protein
MGWIGKGEEYMDYTLLKKKGLLKMKEQELQKSIKTEGDFVDFTSFGTKESAPSSPTPETNTSNFGFLADMASAGTANSSPSPNPLANFETFTPAASTSVSGIPNTVDGKELNALKLKMDDMEYKLDRFIERIDKLEEKLVRSGQ